MKPKDTVTVTITCEVSRGKGKKIKEALENRALTEGRFSVSVETKPLSSTDNMGLLYYGNSRLTSTPTYGVTVEVGA